MMAPRFGHIKLSRKMFDGSDLFWSEKRKFSRAEAWIDLIQMAAWRNNTPYATPQHGADILARGEFVASGRYLAERWKWARTSVQRFIDLLEKAGHVAGQQVGHHGRVYLIVNYDTYQSTPPENGPPGGTDSGPEAGHPRATRGPKKKQLSSKAVQQTATTFVAADASTPAVEVPAPFAVPTPWLEPEDYRPADRPAVGGEPAEHSAPADDSGTATATLARPATAARKRAAAKPEAKYPHYSQEQFAALWSVWLERRGDCDPGRFRRETAGLFRTDPPRYPVADLVAAMKLCIAVLKHRAIVHGERYPWENLTPAAWAGRIVEWVENERRRRLDGEFIHQLCDAPGVRRAS